jgi:hypothetical protein
MIMIMLRWKQFGLATCASTVYSFSVICMMVGCVTYSVQKQNDMLEAGLFSSCVSV